MSKISGKIGRVGYAAIRALKRSSPIILSAAAVTGTVVTTVLAVKATPKAMILIDEAENNKGEALTRFEIIKTSAKVYLPTVISGTATIVCIIGANMLGLKQNASLVGAVSLLDKSYKNYREAAKIVYGEDADRRIRAEIAKRDYISSDGIILYDPDADEGDDVLFYDQYSRRYFTSKLAAVISAEDTVNRHLQLRGYVPINEFYEFLGLERIPGGDVIGWSYDSMVEGGIVWLDFENVRTQIADDGLECCVVSAVYDPENIMEESM